MEAVKVLQNAFKPINFKSFKHLAVGDYVVKNFKVVKTTYGPRVRIEIDEFYMYLPERATEHLDEKTIASLNSNPTIMSYMGKDPEVQNRLLLNFELAKIGTSGEIVMNDNNAATAAAATAMEELDLDEADADN